MNTDNWTPPHRAGGAMRGPQNVPRPEVLLFSDLQTEVQDLQAAASSANGSYPSLSHYTSTSGLCGIIKSGTLWATAYEYLNDTTEGSYGVGLLRDAITEVGGYLTPRRPPNDPLLLGLSGAVEAYRTKVVERLAQGHGQENLVHTCVVCFTGERDQLSQWRGYASGAGGVSLQLPEHSVASLAQIPGWRLVECDYSGRLDPKVIVSIVQAMFTSQGSNGFGPADGLTFETYAVFLANAASSYLTRFKHPKFSEEKEWRLVSLPKSYADLEYRVTDQGLIPYAPVLLKMPSAMNEKEERGVHVTCGPNMRPIATRKAVQGFLWKNDIDGIVTNSEVPSF